jgi:hypothetical protein
LDWSVDEGLESKLKGREVVFIFGKKMRVLSLIELAAGL